MFGSIKKAMAVAAVVGAGALAGPAMASASPLWSQTGASTGTGELTLTVGTSTTTCDVAFSGTLTNSGGTMADGSVTSFLLGVPAGGSCSTSIPTCNVSATSTASVANPWPITGTTGTNRVRISNIDFTNVYTSKPGLTCPLAGIPVNATGTLEGDFVNPGVLSFVNEPGITSTLGAATVSGDVEILNVGTGTPVSLL